MAGRRQPYNTEATGLVRTHTSTWAPAATTNSPLRTTPRKCNLISEMKWMYGKLHAVNYAPTLPLHLSLKSKKLQTHRAVTFPTAIVFPSVRRVNLPSCGKSENFSTHIMLLT